VSNTFSKNTLRESSVKHVRYLNCVFNGICPFAKPMFHSTFVQTFLANSRKFMGIRFRIFLLR